MLEQFEPPPDDTIELPAIPPHRPVALIVTAAAVAVAVLVVVGLLAFGGLGGNAGGGVPASGGLPAISPTEDTGPSPAGTPTTAAPTTTPVAATTAPATGTPGTTRTSSVAIAIINAIMKPAAYRGTNCPGSTTAVATVVVAAPVTITYRWTSTQDVSAPGNTETFAFAAAGSHQFSHAFTNIATPDGQLAATFILVSPVPQRASMVYTQKCGASASKVTIKRSAPCMVAFAATIHAGVGPMKVQYHWELSQTSSGSNNERTWSVPRGGGSTNVATQQITIPKMGVMTARLVLDTPVRFVTDRVTATCP